MKAIPATLAILLVVFAAACSSSKSKADPTPTVGVSTPQATAVPPTPTPLVVTRSRLTTENVGSLSILANATQNGLEGVAWSDDSTQLLAYTKQTVSALENKPNGQVKQLASVTAPESILGIAPSGGGSFVTKLDATQFGVRKLANGDMIKTVQTNTPFADVAISRDGTLAAVQHQDKIAVDLYQLPAGTMVKQLGGFETAAPAYSVRFSADGRSLIWVARAQVQTQDIATGTFGAPLSHEDFVSGVTTRTTPPTLATGAGTSVYVWDAATGAPQGTPLQQDGIVSGVTFSADGTLLAVTSNSGVTFWDARPAPFTKTVTLRGNYRSIALAPDGLSMATTDGSGQAQIWGVVQGPK